MIGRPRKPLDGKADLKAVRQRLKDKNLEGWQRQRLQVAQMGLEGTKTQPQIAEETGVHQRTVRVWFGLLRSGGLEKLLRKAEKGKGPTSWLDEATAGQMQQQLREGKWRRAEDAQGWLEEKLGCKLKLVTVYKYLGKCEARLKVPRPIHARQEPEAVETFRANFRAQLLGKEIARTQRVHIWVKDEVRFGLQPVTRRVWTRKGVEVKAVVHPRYKWGYTFGALELGGASSAEFLHTDTVCQQATAAFYGQLAASDKEAVHIVIADGAGFHLEEGNELLPKNVRIITLPPYSPELNPIEQLWDIVKDRICNRVWEDLDELQGAINRVLEEYWSNPARVRSLLGNHFVHSEANASSMRDAAA